MIMRAPRAPQVLAMVLALVAIACADQILAASTPDKASATQPAGVTGWLNWRGPQQNGVSLETQLPDKWDLGGANDLWSYPLAGRGAPVVARDADGRERVYVMGYRGEKDDLREVIACLDADKGTLLWEHQFTDFLSDIIYNRYSISAPVIDGETGNVYMQTSNGVLCGFDRDGKLLWQRSMMEEFGRLTFPNGRTGAPIVDGDKVIVHGITSNWGAHGAAANRFYAFDKLTGELVWASQPGTTPPKDSSMSTPVVVNHAGKRVLFCGTGCGHVVALNANTGEPIWRYPMSKGGVNVSVVLSGNGRSYERIIALHEDENLDSSKKGRMIAVNIDGHLSADALKKMNRWPDGEDIVPPTDDQTVEGLAAIHAASQPATQPGSPSRIYTRAAERWRNELACLSSSPVLVNDRVYVTTRAGDLACVDVTSGKVLWEKKLVPEQLHASPLWADGKLYIPTYNGLFFIVKVDDQGPTEQAQTQLEGWSLGAPAVWNGRVFVHTTGRLYCFGRARADKPALLAPPVAEALRAGPATAIQVIPSEVLLQPGESQHFRLHLLDANGLFFTELNRNGQRGPDGTTNKSDYGRLVWRSFIPPTALVRSQMDAQVSHLTMTAPENAKRSAGAFEVVIEKLRGTMRGRIVPNLPYDENFESYELNETHKTEAGVTFAYPPLTWIGGRFRWEVRADPDDVKNKVLTKTIDNITFQRGTTFIGTPDMHDYTVEADLSTDGNRRMLSNVGLINQRYLILLDGNAQKLEISSNAERLKVNVDFKIEPKAWYHVKTRVDAGATEKDRLVRAKVWKRGEAEPEKWTLEVPHADGHRQGSPGFFGFAPQGMFRVYLDNLKVTANQK